MEIRSERDKARRQLRIYGMLLLLLAAIDILTMGMELFFEDYSQLLTGLGTGAVVFLIVIALLALGTTGVQIWMGRQALRYAAGTGKGSSHILFARIARVLLVILLVLPLLGWLGGTAPDFDGILSDLISLLIVCDYLRVAKICLN